jgi:DNA-binding MarR family transcriptional regulator
MTIPPPDPRGTAFVQAFLGPDRFRRYWLRSHRLQALLGQVLLHSEWLTGAARPVHLRRFAASVGLSVPTVLDALAVAAASGDLDRRRDMADARRLLYEPSAAARAQVDSLAAAMTAAAATALGRQDPLAGGAAEAVWRAARLAFAEECLAELQAGAGRHWERPAYRLLLWDLALAGPGPHPPTRTIRGLALRLRVSAQTVRNYLQVAMEDGLVAAEWRGLAIAAAGEARLAALHRQRLARWVVLLDRVAAGGATPAPAARRLAAE